MATSLNTIRTVTVRGVSDGLERVKADLQGVAQAQQAVATTGGQMATVTDSQTRKILSVADAVERNRRSLDASVRAMEQYTRTQRALDAGIAQGLPNMQRLIELNRQRLTSAGSPSSSVDQSGINRLLGVTDSVRSAARDSAAVFDTELKRMEDIARVRAGQIGETFHSELNRRMGIGGAAATSRGATYSALEAEVARQDEIAKARAAQHAATSQQAMADRFGYGRGAGTASASAAVFEEGRRESERLAAAAARLRGELDPTGAAFDRMTREIAEYQRMASAGVITTQELAAATTRARAAVDQGKIASGFAAMGSMGRTAMVEGDASRRIASMNSALSATGPAAMQAADGIKLSTHEAANLSRQIGDVGTMLAMGQSPFMVLVSQGEQITAIMGNRGVKGAISALGQAMTALLNPTMLWMAGLTAAAYAATALYETFASRAPTLDESLEKHAALIRDLKEAFGEAAEGMREYADASRTALLVQARGGAAEAAVLMRSGAGDFLGAVGGNLLSREAGAPLDRVAMRYRVDAEFAAFEAPILRLRQTMQAGRPEFAAAIESVNAIARADLSGALDKAAIEITALLRPLANVEAQFKSLGEQADRLSVGTPLLDGYRQYADTRGRSDAAIRRAEIEASVRLPKPSPLRSLAEDPFPMETDFNAQMDEFRRQTEVLQEQAALWGESAYAIEHYRAELELLTIARQNDGVVTEQEMARIREEADLRAEAAAKIAQAEYDRREALDQTNEASRTGRSMLQGMITDLRNGADAATIFANALNRLADRMLDMALDALFQPANPNAPGGIASSPGGPIWQWISGMVGGPSAANSNAPGARVPNVVSMGAGIAQAGAAGAIGREGYEPSYQYAPPSYDGTYGPPLPPADPSRFAGAFGQFTQYRGNDPTADPAWVPYSWGARAGPAPADPSRFGAAFGQFGPPAPPVYSGAPLFGGPGDMGAAAAQAAQAAQTATQSFQGLGATLASTTPQVGGLGQAIASIVGGTPSGGGLGGFFTSLFGGSTAPLNLVPTMHTGGIVGASAAMRAVNDNVFAGARRMHTGGLAGDEVPAILRRGEGVFTREQMAAMAPSGASRSSETQVNIYNSSGEKVATEERQTDIGKIIDVHIGKSLMKGKYDAPMKARFGASVQNTRRA